MEKNNEIAVFGGGCFWCTEAIFKSLKGVINVKPGYAGGDLENPNEFEIHAGYTGHAEVVRIEFDPEVISYSDLLEVFWNSHNPTSIDRQGNDVGSEYKSIILYTTEAQRETAEKSKDQYQKEMKFDNPIVTAILPLDEFYDAEEYHENYYENHKEEPYCQIVISPKLDHLREKFKDKLKSGS